MEFGVEKKIVGKKTFVIIPDYEIPLGRFAGRVVELGIEVLNDYPRRVASSIHIKSSPHLLDKSDTIPKVRNIIDSPLGFEWRYWSHNFGWKEEKKLRRLMNQIKGVLANV